MAAAPPPSQRPAGGGPPAAGGAAQACDVFICVDGNVGYFHEPSCTVHLTAGPLLVRASESKLFSGDLRTDAVDLRRCRIYYMGTIEPDVTLRSSSKEISGAATIASVVGNSAESKVYVFIDTSRARRREPVDAGLTGKKPRAQCTKDLSREWLERFVSTPADVTSPESVRKELSSPISPSLPVMHLSPPMESACSGLFAFCDGLGDESHVEAARPLEIMLSSAYHDSSARGREESSATLVYLLTGKVWRELDTIKSLLMLEEDENVADKSGATHMGRRPDYLLWAKGALLLKAEHKREDGEMRAAESDLATKLEDWRVPGLRNLPFLPCYALAGRWLQFKLLLPTADAKKLSAVPSRASCSIVDVSATFDILVPDQRLMAMAASFNMYRVLAALASLLPPATPKLFCEIRRSDGKIMILGDRVIKTCVRKAPSPVYALLKAGLPGAITVVTADDTSIVMQPVCTERLPLTLAELQSALVSVLSALAGLHRAGYVHRDVRWPNVLIGADDRWRLIDFELAELAGQAAAGEEEESIRVDLLPPEVAAGGTYDFAGDLFRVGRLVAESSLALDEQFSLLSVELSSDNPLTRPTASVALARVQSFVLMAAADAPAAVGGAGAGAVGGALALAGAGAGR